MQKKRELKLCQKLNDVWTNEEICILLKNVILYGENAGIIKSKAIKKSLLSKKLKWMSIKFKIMNDMSTLNNEGYSQSYVL